MIKIPSSRRSLLLIGIAAYILFTIISFPATVALGWFAPDEIQTSNVRGTAWSGHADTVLTPHVILTDATWTVRPLSLLTAKLGFHLNANIDDGVIDTIVSLSPGGSIRLSELTGVLPIGIFPKIAPSVTIDGRLGLTFEELVIEDQWPVDARGTVDIVELQVVEPAAESLGNYEVLFSGAGDAGLEGLITDNGGPLEVEGRLYLPGDRQWQVRGNAKPTSSASAQVSQALGFLGTRNTDGSYKLVYPER